MPKESSAQIVTEALRYAARGWPVFPVYEMDGTHCACRQRSHCERTAKHPRTKNGLKDATVDTAVIKSWWRKWPRANIGVRTGTGLMVLDVDVGERHGDETLADLEARYGKLKPTLTVLTGGGGMHLYFSTTRPVQSTVGDETHGLGPGLDTRGEGGYVIAPPATHKSGNAYAWDLGQGTKVEKLPKWLIPPRGAPVKTDLADADVVVVGGRRNKYLTSFGGKLRHDGASEAVLRAALMAENVQRCRPSLDEKEVLRIAKSVSRYPTAAAKPATSEDKPEWWSLLKLSGKHNDKVKASPGNATVFLCHHDAWEGILRYDEFSDTVHWQRDAPEGGGPGRPAAGDKLSEVHVGYVGHWLARYAGPDFCKDALYTSVNTAAKQNTVHPVREYLSGLQWDGMSRVADWLTEYLDVERDDYSQAVGQWWMISAVARVMEPGCQADHMLVLEGKQGIGKSACARALAGDWYLGTLPDLRHKDSGHALQGNWIVEVGELDAFRGAGATRVKDYLSQVWDSYRPAYARLFVRRPRQCVFIATTNEEAYLDDVTGGRRFWPVRAKRFKRERFTRERDQLWAEALYLYNDGHRWWPSADLVPSLIKQQEERSRIDPWEEIIKKWLIGRYEVGASEVLRSCLDFERGRIEPRHGMRVGAIMHQIGWVSTRRTYAGVRQRVYYDPENSEVW